MTHRDVEDGAMLVEVVLYVPLVAALLWLVLWAGTAGQTPGEVELAASDAARSAAASRDPSIRAVRAQQLAAEQLEGVCDQLEVDTAQSGQVIEVTVACQLHTDPMRGLGVAARTVEAVGISTVDRFIVEGGGHGEP
jgi:Flp pilus assembly protein TadG